MTDEVFGREELTRPIDSERLKNLFNTEQKGDRKMKDEEMAEEYAEKHSFRVPYDGSNKFYDDTDFKASKDGFFAGLKAGRPQWHDLRKDPNDLPKDKEYVLVYTNLTNYYVAEKVENHFMTKGRGFIPMSTVIAWCEIPTFDKE